MLTAKQMLIMATGILALAACKKNDTENTQAIQALPVAAIKVTPQTIPLSFEYPARAVGSKEVQVRARVGGILQKRNYIEGSKVQAGDVLFEIDPAQFEVALSKAKAQLAQSKAQLQSAKQDWSRISKLYSQKVVSEKSKDDAKASLDSAEAAVQMAQAQVDEAELNLSYTKVTAPVAGLTSMETQSEGSLISATGSDSLLTNITQTDPIYVMFSTSEGEIASLMTMGSKGLIRAEEGDCVSEFDESGNRKKCREIKAKVKFSSGDVYSEAGDINFINPTVDEKTGTLQLRAVFPNPKDKIKPGQFVRLVMEGIVRLNALVVPQEAIMQGANSSFVYIVNDKGVAQAVNVITGLSTQDGGWIIDSGLKSGDVVITSNLMKVRPGMQVKASISGEQATTAGVVE